MVYVGKSTYTMPNNPLSYRNRVGLQKLGRRHAQFFKSGNPRFLLPTKIFALTGNFMPRYGRRHGRAAAVINRFGRGYISRRRTGRRSPALFPNYVNYAGSKRSGSSAPLPAPKAQRFNYPRAPNNKGYFKDYRHMGRNEISHYRGVRGTLYPHANAKFTLRRAVRKFLLGRRRTSMPQANAARTGAIQMGRFQKGGRFDERTYVSKWFKPYEKGYNKIDWKGLREKKMYHRVEETSFEVQSHVGEQGSFATAIMDRARLNYILLQDPLTDGAVTADPYEYMNRIWMKKSIAKYMITNACNLPVRVRMTVYDYINNSSRTPIGVYDLDRVYTGYADKVGVPATDGSGTLTNSTYDLQTIPGVYPYTTGHGQNFVKIRYQKDMMLNVGNSTFVTVPSQWHKKVVNPILFLQDDAGSGPATGTLTYLKGCTSVVYFTTWTNTIGSTSTGSTIGINTENIGQAQIAVKAIRTNEWYVADTISVKHDYTRTISTIVGATQDANLNVMQDTNQTSQGFKKT